MKRVNWRFVWLICWALFLVADQFLDLRARITAAISGSEAADPGAFHYRVQTALLVGFVIVALVPLLWPLLRRRLFSQAAPPASRIEQDPRDLSAAEAIAYLIHRSAWAAGQNDDEQALTAAAVRLLEDAARKARVSLRGVAPGGSSREPIPPDYWLSGGIDTAATLDPAGSGGQTGPRAETQSGKRERALPVYTSLVMGRDDLMRLFPPDNFWRRSGRAAVRGLRPRRRENPAESD